MIKFDYHHISFTLAAKQAWW